MKKVVAILLMAAVVFAVVGCNGIGGKTLPVGVYVPEIEVQVGIKVVWLRVVDGENIVIKREIEGYSSEGSLKYSHKEKDIFEVFASGSGKPSLLFYYSDTKTINISGLNYRFSHK